MAVGSVQSQTGAGNVAGDHLSPSGFDYNRIAGVNGNRNITPEFIRGVEAMAERIGTRPEYVLAVMSFETGGSFSPGVRNAAGSGATGLIQFMPATARELGTSTDALARMSATEQLEYVERYFARRSDPGDLNTLEGVYTTVLYGSPRPDPGSTLFASGTAAYRMNAPLDLNGDGRITAGEATSFVRDRIDGEAPSPIDRPTPAPGPSPSPAPDPSPDAGDRYTVRSGDTLGAIAMRHGTSVDALMRANPQIRNRDLIFPGQQLALSGAAAGTSYTIRAGDTLSGIAASRGTTVDALMQANPGIRNRDLIFAGQSLAMPGGNAPQAEMASYTVRSGDTLGGIAARNGSSVGELMQANPGIRDSNLIYAGQTISIPRGHDAPAPGPSPAPTPAPSPTPPISGEVPTYAPYTVYSTGHRPAFAVNDPGQMQPHHDYQTTTRNGQTLEVRDIVLHRNGQSQLQQAVPSPLEGTVVRAGPMGGAGNAVVVRDDNGREAWLFHFSSIDVQVGQRVGYGQDLGNQGSTGNSTGPHVHIEAPSQVMHRWVNDLLDGRFDGRRT
ncbi:MAG TPA: LysM peptidoglycan-binding domain-containing protein [Luteimonas sp.]|nr:LysM peptidoglycan-binding domain-containing protein [Luteimonas sp.]HRP73565.1 LysM peptidoglycan-binding domain-containing protein [Luteimonas sp.]